MSFPNADKGVTVTEVTENPACRDVCLNAEFASGKFHFIDCKYAFYRKRNNWITLKRWEAVELGRHSCLVCRP